MKPWLGVALMLVITVGFVAGVYLLAEGLGVGCEWHEDEYDGVRRGDFVEYRTHHYCVNDDGEVVDEKWTEQTFYEPQAADGAKSERGA